MPWHTRDVMTLRAEFVMQAKTGRYTHLELCRRFGICGATGYKWLGRFNRQRSLESLKDLSRRPQRVANKTPDVIESCVIELRKQYPRWGAKKLKVLFAERHPDLKVPSERTLNRIIVRNGLLSEQSPRGVEFKRFEYESPNDLWQMDYKGEFLIRPRQYCYPLTVLDDYSRFNLILDAHPAIQGQSVRDSLTTAFRRHGMPWRMLMDQGSPWYAVTDTRRHWTHLSFWLMKLDIQVIFSRSHHPQTLGKDERFHRTLKYDLIERSSFESFEEAQRSFDAFRHEYNHIRPHEAIGLKRPSERYLPSARTYPEAIEPPKYPSGSMVRKVSPKGRIKYAGLELHVHRALEGEPVQLIDKGDGFMEIYYRNTLVREHDLKA